MHEKYKPAMVKQGGDHESLGPSRRGYGLRFRKLGDLGAWEAGKTGALEVRKVRVWEEAQEGKLRVSEFGSLGV